MLKDILKSRFPLVFGGFMGFSLVALINYNTGATFSILIQNASIATVVGAFLGKIFTFLLASAVKSSTIEKEKARMQHSTDSQPQK